MQFSPSVWFAHWRGAAAAAAAAVYPGLRMHLQSSRGPSHVSPTLECLEGLSKVLRLTELKTRPGGSDFLGRGNCFPDAECARARRRLHTRA